MEIRNVAQQKGITLMSLIITIIVLLILAGVVLYLGIGENGILKYAEYSSKKYTNEERNEEIAMNNMINQINEYSMDIQKPTREDLASLTQATATQEDISNGKTAWVNGKMLTGTNDNNIKAYVLGSIAIYSTNTTQSAASGYSSNKDYFTCVNNVGINYLTINVLKDMNITIVLHDSGRGNVANRTIAINNTTISQVSLSIGGNYVYETNVSAGDVIKITADRTSGNVRGISILILGK